MPTPIVYGDHLYTCSNNGILNVYDAKTGAQVYHERIAGTATVAFTASPVAADGKMNSQGEDQRPAVPEKPDTLAGTARSA